MSQPPEQPAWGPPDRPDQPPAYPYGSGPQPPPAQPYPAQPYPAQPYPAQPYPEQPYDRPGWPVFRDVSALGTAVLVISAVVALGDVLSAATSFAAVDAYRAAGRGEEVFTAHDGIGLVSLLQLPNWIIASLWLATARRNAVQLAPQEVRRGPAWCWLGWIVPIVSLWFPRRMVNDVWRATAAGLPPGHPDHRDVRSLPPTALWWTLWIVYLVLGNIAGRAAFSDPGTDGGVLPELEIAVAVASVAALICWIRVVRGLTRVQRALAAGPPAPAAGPSPYSA